MSSEMRECPFCGNGAWVVRVPDTRRFRPQCKKCGADLGEFDREADAVAAWNRRTLLARGEAGADGDKGPWRWKRTGSKVDVYSDDFTHDVALRIDGDFASEADADVYAAWLAGRLNTHPQDASGDAAKLSEVERKAVTDLMESQVYEAGDVDDEPPRIDEDEDAYWAYHNYHGLRKLLAMQAKEAK